MNGRPFERMSQYMYECQFSECEKIYMRRAFKKGERKEALAEAEEDKKYN